MKTKQEAATKEVLDSIEMLGYNLGLLHDALRDEEMNEHIAMAVEVMAEALVAQADKLTRLHGVVGDG